MKDELGGNIMTEFVAFRSKTYSYLMDNSNTNKKAEGAKKCVIKRTLKFNDYKNCLMNNKTVLKSQQRFKSELHNVYTKEIRKISVSSNADKSLQTFDRINDYTTENRTEHNLKYIYFLDHPYKILIIRSSGSGKQMRF